MGCLLHQSPKSYKKVFIFVGLTLTVIFICCFMKLSIQTFQSLFLIYRRGNFVYQHRVCSSIYRLLSYPFRSLHAGLFHGQFFTLKKIGIGKNTRKYFELFFRQNSLKKFLDRGKKTKQRIASYFHCIAFSLCLAPCWRLQSCGAYFLTYKKLQ